MEYLKVWTSFRQVISPLDDAEKGRLFDAMLAYAETGEEPDGFAGNERFLWPVAKRDIDMTAQKCERLAKNGAAGGTQKAINRRQAAANDNKSQETLTNDNKSQQAVANDSKSQQTIANDSQKEKKRNEIQSKTKEGNTGNRFAAPTPDEVRAYCRERGNRVDADRFCDFYASKGWRVGNQPMKDWRAAVRTWERDDKQAGKPAQGMKPLAVQNYEQRDYTDRQAELFRHSLMLAEAVDAG